MLLLQVVWAVPKSLPLGVKVRHDLPLTADSGTSAWGVVGDETLNCRLPLIVTPTAGGVPVGATRTATVFD